MSIDIFLLGAAAILSALLAALGFLMANNPESIPRRKKTYGWIFFVLCFLLLIATVGQAVHTDREQRDAKRVSVADKKRLEEQLGSVQGQLNATQGKLDLAQQKLDLIAKLAEHSSLDGAQLAAAVHSMSVRPTRGWPADSTDAHSVAVLKFLSANFPEVMDLNERERFFVYYLMQHGGNMSSTPDEWANLEKLYAAQFHWTHDAAKGVASQSWDQLRVLRFIQTPGVQEPTLAEPYYSRLRALLARGEKVP